MRVLRRVEGIYGLDVGGQPFLTLGFGIEEPGSEGRKTWPLRLTALYQYYGPHEKLLLEWSWYMALYRRMKEKILVIGLKFLDGKLMVRAIPGRRMNTERGRVNEVEMQN